MFGMGFGEILLVAIVAIIFLGPEKLPQTMVDIAKFFRSIKNNITQAKDALENEINIADMKKEALEYKDQIEKSTKNIYEETSSITSSQTREVNELFSDLKNDTPAKSSNPDDNNEKKS